MPEDDAKTCIKCGESLEESPQTGSFGFRVLDCPRCGERTWLPLARSWRITYWVIIGLGAAALLTTLGSGIIAVPGAVTVVAATFVVRDAMLRKSPRNSTVVTAVVTAGAVSTVFAVVLAIGLGNGYTTTVVDREETTDTVVDGLDLRESTQICGDNADYNTCVNMHVAMYNSVCVSYPSWRESLTPGARVTCNALGDFIDDAKKRYQSCGAGCVTIADDGKWGYPYLLPVPNEVPVARAAVTHAEHCFFDLGLVKLGVCPGRS